MQFPGSPAVFEHVRRYAMFADIIFVLVFAKTFLHHAADCTQRPVVSQIGVYERFAEEAAAAALVAEAEKAQEEAAPAAETEAVAEQGAADAEKAE